MSSPEECDRCGQATLWLHECPECGAWVCDNCSVVAGTICNECDAVEDATEEPKQ